MSHNGQPSNGQPNPTDMEDTQQTQVGCVATADGGEAADRGDQKLSADMPQRVVAEAIRSSLAGQSAIEEVEFVTAPESTHMCSMCSLPCESGRCNPCNSTRVGLSKIYGAWPTPAFKDLKQEEKTLFYRNAHCGNNATALKALVEHTLTRYHDSYTKEGTGGDYQPLSYWERLGYDPAHIKAKCHDTLEHAVLGTCYNLHIVSKHVESIDGTTRAEKRKVECSATESDSSSSSSTVVKKAKKSKAKGRSKVVAKKKSPSTRKGKDNKKRAKGKKSKK